MTGLGVATKLEIVGRAGASTVKGTSSEALAPVESVAVAVH